MHKIRTYVQTEIQASILTCACLYKNDITHIYDKYQNLMNWSISHLPGTIVFLLSKAQGSKTCMILLLSKDHLCCLINSLPTG